MRTWEVQYGSSSLDYALGIAVDSSGDVFIAGRTVGGSLHGTNIGGNYAFLVKLSGSSGVELWECSMAPALMMTAEGWQ